MFLKTLRPLCIKMYVITSSPIETIDALTNVCIMKAFKALDITMQYNPVMK